MNWDGYGVYQRRRNDCGIAAVATLAGLPYEAVADIWKAATGRNIGSSHYNDLIAALGYLGIGAEKAPRPLWGIRRARHERRSNHHHWIVTYAGGDLWCPYSGYHARINEYEMPFLGYGVRLL